MERKSKGLTAKEKTFCNCFVSCGSADEAAYNAGFVRNPKRSGEELLCREDIADEIKRTYRQGKNFLQLFCKLRKC